MHDYKVIDLIEVYEAPSLQLFGGLIEEIESIELVEHNYVLVCMECKKKRTVKESTFNKMFKLGLIK